MASLLVVIGVAAVVFLWVKAARGSRQRWLARLDLPGTWRWENHDGSLELTGSLSHGNFRMIDGAYERSGEWRLVGHELRLTDQTGSQSNYDLRFFDAGKIGLHRSGEDARVYLKTPSNVVPMRRGNG